MDPGEKRIRWSPILGISRRDWNSWRDGELIQWDHRSVSALTAPGHRWMEQNDQGRKRGDNRPHTWSTTGDLIGRTWARLVFGGGTPSAFPNASPHSDEFVELLGWIVAEGCYPKPKGDGSWNHVSISQSERVNPEKTAQLRRLASHFTNLGYTFNEYKVRPDGVVPFYIGSDLGAEIRTALPDKQLPPLLIASLTLAQAQILYQALIDGDGNRHVGGGDYWIQVDQGRIDSFQMLAAMLASRTAQKTWDALNGVSRTTIYTRDGGTSGSTHPSPVDYVGVIWHPELSRSMAWAARRAGTTYWTGSPELTEPEAARSQSHRRIGRMNKISSSDRPPLSIESTASTSSTSPSRNSAPA
ncbi:hypothetical protein OOK39_42775 [Streptomyces sp. NBC_00264]|nr:MULTISPECIES: hypothetical protein [unclassified Streptomyces]RPK54461.1 hypothetical protein EES42_42890 [Streptomyces sp. ADI95-17]MCX4399566.1 hypothetical protein [Streptomyces sp. NBC_01767]MCX5165521.1 hypothetical protein [Streptomyces sp. NBC_00305]MCX5224346.1 hypothetical protein [Streptomyces sp. NBC_00264]MDV9195973.1 hypothetical protein [Streptomyces sp. Wh19]